MAENILKPKIQLRSINVTTNGNSNSGENTPTTPSKLMINHGKPNFTIQRSPKAQNGDENPLSQELQNKKNNNYNAYKSAGSLNYSNSINNNVVISTKFNGAFKPTNVPIAQKQPHQSDDNENEAAKVVLRRPRAAEPLTKDDEDDSVPEFIRRQRRIQERLAKENVLDFESRRSGYFTHVVISPSSPNRKSFGETMSSPAVVPALEIPPPATHVAEQIKEEEAEVKLVVTNGTNNVHVDVGAEEEEVARAIEEVNKAVAGEDDDKQVEELEAENVEPVEDVAVVTSLELTEELVENVAVVTSLELTEEPLKDAAVVTSLELTEEPLKDIAVVTSLELTEEHPWHPVATSLELIEEPVKDVAVATSLKLTEEPALEPNKHVDEKVSPKDSTGETIVVAVATAATLEHIESEDPEASKQNGHIEVEVKTIKENGTSDITISHTNGFDGPSIPSPDPSGNLGVNYEPKTVVSFSKDLSSEPNRYPDTVKVVNENGDVVPAPKTPVNEELQQLTKLKFDIKADEQDVEVTPVLRAE